ncbi:MAG TPA: hypothetical protein VKF38_11025 [Anaerolineaceae bacterium]|nr:hypothetical protein [Anaerolineaceae bacterium]
MVTQNTEETAPIKIQSGANKSIEKKVRKPRRWPWVMLGVLLILLFGAIGAYLGYRNALAAKIAAANSQKALAAATQFELGLADQKAGKLAQAQERFEWVISVDPNFPGAAEKLTEVMMAQAVVNTPTPQPLPTLTPTVDTRGVDALFSQAQSDLRNKQWQAAIDTMETLRKDNINYHAVDIDGMYYIALRNLGVENILSDGNLEGGIYDLTLAERFGPLDRDADGYRTWARYYITGASFWGIDWSQVISYFSQVVPAFPNLRDGSGITATERYRIALEKYGDQLAGNGDYCGARAQYKLALSYGSDTAVAPTATAIANICSPPATKTPKPPTEQPTGEGPTNVPPTEKPSDTPSSGDTPTPHP